MPNQKIEIQGIDPGTGKLILSDGGRTEVNSKWILRKVTWKITNQKIKSFLIVGKTAYNPFETPIPVSYDTEVKLKVSKDEPEMDWEYSIYWKDEDSKVTNSDPIISIKPSTFLPPLPIKIIGSFLGFLGISYLTYLWMKRMKMTKKNKHSI